MKYCTYARKPGILGWLMGWYLVGINTQPAFGGYAGDFAGMGFILMLIEYEAPLPYRFHFLPKKAKVLAYHTKGKTQWMSKTPVPMK